MSSIFLFSERQKKCVELKIRGLDPAELVTLQGLLPRHLRGVSFVKPAMASDVSKEVLFHSETREPQVARYLGEVSVRLLEVGQPLGALRFLDLSLRLRKDAERSLLRTEILISLGRIDEAFSEVDRFLKWQRHHGWAHYLLGRVYLGQSHYQAAQESFQNAMALLPKQDSRRKIIENYIQFNQIYLDRDSLYGKNLKTTDYVAEIRILRKRCHAFKKQVAQSAHREVRGMEPYLDQLEKLFECWMEEMGTHAGLFENSSKIVSTA